MFLAKVHSAQKLMQGVATGQLNMSNGPIAGDMAALGRAAANALAATKPDGRILPAPDAAPAKPDTEPSERSRARDASDSDGSDSRKRRKRKTSKKRRHRYSSDSDSDRGRRRRR